MTGIREIGRKRGASIIFPSVLEKRETEESEDLRFDALPAPIDLRAYPQVSDPHTSYSRCVIL